jgi:hypothetical protein
MRTGGSQGELFEVFELRLCVVPTRSENFPFACHIPKYKQ